MGGGGGEEPGSSAGIGNVRELDQTPTWAVASVCTVIVVISIVLEKALHHLGEVGWSVSDSYDSYVGRGCPN